MKKAAYVVIVAALLLAVCIPAFAQEFPDVPTDHWAYPAVQYLAEQGIIQGYPDGTFGGERTWTRYEFAEAIAKAIPIIEKMILDNLPTPEAPAPAPPPEGGGPVAPPPPPTTGGATNEDLNAVRVRVETLEKLMNEFKDELAGMGVDVSAAKKEMAALSAKVDDMAKKVASIPTISGWVNLIGIGTLRNSGAPRDIDSSPLGALNSTDPTNPLANSQVFSDLGLGITANVSGTSKVTALIDAGSYLQTRGLPGVNEFTLYHLYLDTPVSLGSVGPAQVVVGRYPLSLTPYTLKFVDPDSYTNVAILDSGDFVLEGGNVKLALGPANITAFAGKANPIASAVIVPNLTTRAGTLVVSQLAGARAVMGMPFGGNLGVTAMAIAHTTSGVLISDGVATILGADINTSLSGIGIAAEFTSTGASEAMEEAVAGINSNKSAWNAKLTYKAGSLDIAGGYGVVEQNFAAPGSWSRIGRAVNLTNVKGETLAVSYVVNPGITLVAEGQLLKPNTDGSSVNFRSSISPAASAVAAGVLEDLTWYKAGVKYALTSSNAIDLGFEEARWKPATGDTATERYISIGLGHTLNAGASLKLLYQIVDYKSSAAIDPYSSGAGNYRGGVATAQFQLKY